MMLLKSSYNSRGKKGFCSIFISQHPLRAAYTFLPVPASVIVSVAKHNSQTIYITSFCLNQLKSIKKPQIFLHQPSSCYSKELRVFPHQLNPEFHYFRPICTILQVFHNRKKKLLKVGKIIRSFNSQQLMESRLNSYLALNYCHPLWLRTDGSFVGLEKVGERDTKRE